MRGSLLIIAGKARGVPRAILALGLIVVMVLALVAVANNARPTLVLATASSGPNYPDSGAYESGPGTIIWNFPGYVTADDSNYATASLGINVISYYLKATDYDFTIPTNATITGIEVKIGRFASGSNDIRDYEVRLVKGGSVTGDNKADTGTTWPTGSPAEVTYGSSSELWGTTWSYSDINATNFGVALAAKNFAATAPMAEVDYMKITVTYMPSPPSLNEAATLYNSAESATVSQMTPQTEYALKVTVTDAGTIDHLSTVTATIFYDSDTDDDYSDIPAANTQTCFIMTCTVGSTPVWSQNPSSSTTWDIVETSCDQPTLTDTSGDFWFHFKPGKVATEALDWDVYVSVTDEASDSDTWYDAGDYDMLWYGEISVATSSVDWGTVYANMDFSNGSAKESVSATYISNGNYDVAVSTGATWSTTATLNTAGTPGSNEFSLKAWSSDSLPSADLVTTTAGDCVIDNTGDLTTESGDASSSNTLYLKTGTPFVQGVYSGTIYFYIRNR
jgi:hypothetical protein